MAAALTEPEARKLNATDLASCAPERTARAPGCLAYLDYAGCSEPLSEVFVRAGPRDDDRWAILDVGNMAAGDARELRDPGRTRGKTLRCGVCNWNAARDDCERCGIPICWFHTDARTGWFLCPGCAPPPDWDPYADVASPLQHGTAPPQTPTSTPFIQYMGMMLVGYLLHAVRVR